MLVVTISFLLALSQFSVIRSLEIACAILAGQCVVGWTNDLLDYPLDLAAGRRNKPLVVGDITQSFLKKSIFVALAFAVLLSLVGPLGLRGSTIHFLGIGSATAYNCGLKKTLLSVLPYVIALAINSFAHLNSKSQLALAAFVVMLNIASFLSFDTELKQFAALTADAAGEKSQYVKMGAKVPYTAFRLFCFVISVVAIVTQLRAIYA